MQLCNVHSNRRDLFIAACVIGALIAQTASADCPPGYRSKAGHCIPGQAQPHQPLVMKSVAPVPTAVSPMHANKPHSYAHVSSVTPVHASATHSAEPRTAQALQVKHHAGPASAGSSYKYDLEAQHEAKADTHGIIFVGGKQALNPQPIPPGKNALNPQPIPPGHVMKKLPPPGAPIENAAGH